MRDIARKKKHLHLLAQIAVSFKIQYLKKASKLWEICISNNKKNSLDLFIFMIWNLVVIYFRDSISNFRLLHLMLDYIIDNLK